MLVAVGVSLTVDIGAGESVCLCFPHPILTSRIKCIGVSEPDLETQKGPYTRGKLHIIARQVTSDLTP